MAFGNGGLWEIVLDEIMRVGLPRINILSGRGRMTRAHSPYHVKPQPEGYPSASQVEGSHQESISSHLDFGTSQAPEL